jgi:hypothetical protein
MPSNNRLFLSKASLFQLQASFPLPKHRLLLVIHHLFLSKTDFPSPKTDFLSPKPDILSLIMHFLLPILHFLLPIAHFFLPKTDFLSGVMHFLFSIFSYWAAQGISRQLPGVFFTLKGHERFVAMQPACTWLQLFLSKNPKKQSLPGFYRKALG